MNSTPVTVPLHVLNDGDRCLCCRWPRESGENNNRGKHAFHSGNLVVWKVAINKTAIGRHYSRVSAARTARRSEAHADHGVTASAASAAAAYDAGAGKDLLASARCFRPCSPWLFALRLAVRLFAARSRIILLVVLAVRLFATRPCVVLVVVVAARGGRRCRRFFAGDAGLSFCRLARLAFEGADARVLLAQIDGQNLGHVMDAS